MEDTLRLGYAFLNPPGAFRSLVGFKGYNIDAFTHFARVIRRRLDLVKVISAASVPHDQERSPFVGVPGAIENGSIFTFLEQNELTPIRVHAFEYIFNQMMGLDLYDGVVFATNEDTSLYHFIVFAPSTLALIAVTILVLGLPFLKYGSQTRFIANFFLLYGVLLVLFFHGAGFQGNTSFPPPIPARNLEYYLSRMRSGQVGLMTAHGNTVKTDDRVFLVGNPTQLLTITDYSEVVNRLCSLTRKYFVTLGSSEYAQLPEPPSGCRLRKIDPSILMDGKLQKFRLFFDTKATVFLLQKQTSKKWLEELKWLYNTFFSLENRMGILYRRYSKTRAAPEPIRPEDPILPTYSPFTITRLSSILYTFIALILLSIVVFIAELTLPITKLMRWIRKSRKNLYK